MVGWYLTYVVFTNEVLQWRSQRQRPRMYKLGTCLKNVDVAIEMTREDLRGRLHLEGD